MGARTSNCLFLESLTWKSWIYKHLGCAHSTKNCRAKQTRQIRKTGKLSTHVAATPLLLVLVTVEVSDVIFALDSIPAIFGVSRDPFIIYTSNIFAILGLRALYFLLAALMQGLRFLEPAVALVLLFIGGKMIASNWGIHLATGASLGVVGLLLASGIGCSVIFPGKCLDVPQSPGENPKQPQG